MSQFSLNESFAIQSLKKNNTEYFPFGFDKNKNICKFDNI
jgi:hypothetical protein